VNEVASVLAGELPTTQLPQPEALAKPTGSKLSDQILNADIKRTGHSQQCVKANPLLAALHFSNIDGMEVGFLGESLLAQARIDSMCSNRFTQDSSLLLDARHQFARKQEGQKVNTPNMGLIWFLRPVQLPTKRHDKEFGSTVGARRK
jgi:hypothetical protein